MKLLLIKLIKIATNKGRTPSVFSLVLYLGVAGVPLFTQAIENSPTITERQARALKMLNQQPTSNQPIKNLRLTLIKLSDSQGQPYLGALINRVDLSPYLTQLKDILQSDFDTFRVNQATRDHQTFHMTLINPKEYQHIDKQLVDKLLSPNLNVNFSSQLQVRLLGVGKAERGSKSSYFVVAQSHDAQLIRQRFLLSNKDFHVTLGFEPSDVHGVKKNASTLMTIPTKP